MIHDSGRSLAIGRRSKLRRRLRAPLIALFGLASATALAATPAPAGVRVFDTRSGVVSSPEAAFDAAARADLVFMGEQHDDAAAHRFELALLQGLADRGRPVVLVMEMFERDVQPALDDYLAGRIDEAQMLARSRPWSNYRTDYRPLVELARAKGWPVVAGNIPRSIAAKIARKGPAELAALPPAERQEVAAELQCDDGAYRRKFIAEMSQMAGHSGKGGAGPDLGRMFDSQCAKDETMAESLAKALKPGTTLVQVNGSFHSDEGLGVVERLRRRRPDARALVISIAPGASPPGAQRALGDFVVWTP